MRLFLSSYSIGNDSSLLTNLVRGSKVAVINNAADYKPASEKLDKLQREFEIMSSIDFECTELDLRNYFNSQDTLASELQKYDLIWVRGGNAFVLKRAMERSGFEQIIRQMLDADTLVYGGYSAGVCVVTPTLRGIELVDNPSVEADGYDGQFSWDGIGLIDYSVAPHYKSDHPESEAIDRTVEYFKKNHMPYKALRDGEVLVVGQQ